MIKPCRKCGVEAEHYTSIPTCCKECWKDRVRANRSEKAEQYRAFDRKRNQTPKRKELFIKKQIRMRAANPFMGKSHLAINRAIKKGTLIRPDHCSRCMVQCEAQGHHDDHSKPLEVMWLCPICHAQRHVELAKIKASS